MDFAHTNSGAVVLSAITITVFLIPIFILFPPFPVDHTDALQQTHSKIGVPPSKSALRTQYSSLYQPKPDQPAKIHSLFIYPIKSCRGIEVKSAKVLPSGLEHDRLYTFAYFKPKPTAAGTAPENAWQIITLRQFPLLARVKVEIWLPDARKTNEQLGKIQDGFIIVRFPWRNKGLRGFLQLLQAKMSNGWDALPEKNFLLPLEFPSQDEIKKRCYEYANITIWRDELLALSMGCEVPPELALFLGVKHPLGLFRMDPVNQRPVFRCAPRKHTIGYQPVVDFHDASKYPLHMLSLLSVRALEAKIQKDKTLNRLDARRFRANILISGVKAYDEDDWKAVRFGREGDAESSNVFDVSCRTVRCKLPNVDPITGVRHKAEPDGALRKFRGIDEGAPKEGCLGMQLCPVFPRPGELRSLLEVGMEADILERGAHFYLQRNQNNL